MNIDEFRSELMARIENLEIALAQSMQGWTATENELKKMQANYNVVLGQKTEAQNALAILDAAIQRAEAPEAPEVPSEHE